MSRQLSEKQVLEMLGIPDFRHLSKDRIMSFTSALPQMEPQVAIAALQQVPHFADTSLEIMRIYKETVSQTLAEDQENVQSFNASCDMVLGLVTFSPACRGGGFLLKNPSGFSIDRLSPHALWFARFMSRATR